MEVGTAGNERLLFLHVPKTGGHWVAAALEAAGVEVTPEGGTRHAGLSDVSVGGRFAFAFVREPLSWYASWWKHCRVIDRTWLDTADAYPDAPHVHYVGLPFEDYVAHVLSEQPHVTNLYRQFTPIDFVGRHESLAGDLVSALTLAGEDFDEDALRAVGPLNASGSSPSASPALARLVERAEHEVYERFYESRLTARAPAGLRAWPEARLRRAWPRRSGTKRPRPSGS